MQRKTRFIQFTAPLILIFSLMLVYLHTMAPGLTWANEGSDGGDLITAAATTGVAHPSGYPLYLLLASLFQLLPIGSLAFRTNIMSAVAAVTAAWFVYQLVTCSLPPVNGGQNWLAGLTSAYAFGLSPLLWSQAVITEVYTLHTLFVVFALYLSSDISHSSIEGKRLDRIMGLVIGLAIGNHITSILLFPLLLPSKVFFKSSSVKPANPEGKFNPGTYSLVRRLTWLGIGLLTYLSLPLRALSNPPVNWGNPVTPSSFVWLVSGRLYQGQFLDVSLSSMWLRIQSATALLIDQVGIPGLVIGFLGLVFFRESRHLYRNTIWVFSAFSALAIIYATHDSFVYLIPAILSFALWIGWGLGVLMDMFIHRQATLGAYVAVIFMAYVFMLAGNSWEQVDASQDLRAERFGEQVLAQAPANAIIFARGDKAIFTMWYFHYALHNRPDIAVVVPDLLIFDWYQHTLQTNYPNLEVPPSFPLAAAVTAANPERPVCYIQYFKWAQVDCFE